MMGVYDVTVMAQNKPISASRIAAKMSHNDKVNCCEVVGGMVKITCNKSMRSTDIGEIEKMGWRVTGVTFRHNGVWIEER